MNREIPLFKLNRCLAAWAGLAFAWLVCLYGCDAKLKVSTVTGENLPAQALASDATVLNGYVKPIANLSLTGKVWRLATSPLCASAATVDLVKHVANGDGGVSSQTLASANVETDGHFSFDKDAEALHVDLDADDALYTLDFYNCGHFISRPLTADGEQDLTYGSTILAFAADYAANAPDKLSQLVKNRASVAALVDDVAASNSPIDAFNQLKLLDSKNTDFSDIFQMSVDNLIDLPPKVMMVKVPDTFAEGKAAELSALAVHWHPDYTPAYLWKMGKVIDSSQAANSIVLTGDTQGQYQLQLFVGRDLGDGKLSTDKPFQVQEYPVTVQDTIPATSPPFWLQSALSEPNPSVLTRDVVLSLETGEQMRACDSFASLAITENQTEPPSDQAYTIHCTSGPLQPLSYAISTAGYGDKVLRLWAKDSSGNVSASPTSLTIVLNDQTPALSFDAPATGNIIVASGSAYNVIYTTSDSDAAATVNLYYKLGSNSGCDAANIGSWTSFGGALGEGMAAPVSFTPPADGTFYFCGVVQDKGHTIYAMASDGIKVDTAPTMSLVEPDGTADLIAQKAPYSVTWTDSDQDDDATIALYYKATATGACSTGTLIASGLSEDADGNNGSYSWDTTTVAPGSYYVCARITDSINPDVESWSSGALTINAAPTLNITAPATTDQKVAQDASFTIQMTAADPDDTTTFALSYANAVTGDCTAGTSITPALSKSTTSYSWDTTGIAPGTYYICGHMSDGVNADVVAWSSKAVVIDARPTVAVVTPAADNPIAAQKSSFTIDLTASDADSAATVNLYYESTADAACSGATAITSGLAKTVTTYNWDLSSVPPGAYYVCARISDGVNPAAYAVSPGVVHIDAVPTLVFTAPASRQNIEVQTDSPMTISWTTADPEENATITLYYETSSSGDCATSGTLIASGLHEDSDTSYDWNTSSITASGLYYLCAKVDDGINAPVSVYDTAAPIVLHRNCTWTGTTDTSWTTATNWTACAGGAPAWYDRILVPTGTSHDLTISGNANFGGFQAGSGGGTVTIAAGADLIFSKFGYATIESSVTLKGETTTCANCLVTLNENTTIKNSAMLTLSNGVTLSTCSTCQFNIGDSTSAGHLQTVPSTGIPAEYPHVGSLFTGFVIQGSGTEKSSLSITGLYVLGATSSSFLFKFVSDYQIDHLDSLYIPSTAGMGSILSLDNCSTSTFNDTGWTDWLLDPNSTVGRFLTDAGTCTGSPVITVSGSGAYYGEAVENGADHADIISWANGAGFTCTWVGTNSTDWTDPGNWANCSNGRNNYPDFNDQVIITNGPARQPTISAPRLVFPNGINLTGVPQGSEGTISVAPGSTLYFSSLSSAYVRGPIKFQGTVSTCTTCTITSSAVYVYAQLTLGHGIIWSAGSGGVLALEAGSGLKTDSASTNPDEWPSINRPIELETGTVDLDVNGLKIMSKGLIYPHIRITTGNQVKSLKNVIFDTPTTTDDYTGTYIQVADCSASFLDTNWSGLDFVDGFSPSGRNIRFVNCTTLTPGSISVGPHIGGVNTGYGPDLADDPTGVVSWQ